MKPGARIQAAIEVLSDVIDRHRPASMALADWGRSHRFAGSGDRAAIGNLVYDALRNRYSIASRMQDDTARALILGAAPDAMGLSPEEVAGLADGSTYSAPPLSEAEKAGLTRAVAEDAPAFVKGDFPEWLAPSFERAFGERAVQEGAALSRRAPIDLRVNSLKATREKVLKALERQGAEATSLSPLGVRIAPPRGGARAPNVEAEAAHGKGWFEVQDEGSQIAALLAGAGPRQQVLDLCAGAGGKSLAFAASMQNTGQVYAYDSDKAQLRPIFERLKRAGARNVQVMDAGDEAGLETLGARFDLVFVDAPCSGSGTWRRRPDAKWRLSEENLEARRADQKKVLATAARMVKPGGRIVYVTCSVLPEENCDQVRWFCETHEGFQLSPYADVWQQQLGTDAPVSSMAQADGLQLTPAGHGTDGFYMAILSKNT